MFMSEKEKTIFFGLGLFLHICEVLCEKNLENNHLN